MASFFDVMLLSFAIWIFFLSLLSLLLFFLIKKIRHRRSQANIISWKVRLSEEQQKNEEAVEISAPEKKEEGKKLLPSVLADMEKAEKCLEEKRYEEAARLFISVLAHDEDHSEANAQLAYAYLQMKEFPRAENLFRKALITRPEDPTLLTNFAISLFEQGSPEALFESLEALQKAVQVDDKNPERYANFGQSLFFAGRLEEAFSVFSEAVRLSPRRLELLFFLGDTLLALQRYPEAKDVFEKILRISPNNAEARAEYEKIQVQLGSVSSE